MNRRTIGFAAVLSLISVAILRYQTGRVLAVFDFTYYTDVAVRIQDGLVPYRDIPLFASPGTYLELAGLFAAAGRDYSAIFFLMAGKSTVVCFAATYLISARVGGAQLPGRYLIYGTVGLVSVLNVYSLFFQPFYDADAVAAVMLSACLIVAAWRSVSRRSLARHLLRIAAGASIFLPFLYKQTFGIAWIGVIAVAGLGAAIGHRDTWGRTATIGLGLVGLATIFAGILASLGALHPWKYWTVDYPLTIRNSSYFALFDGLGSQERWIIMVFFAAGATAAISRRSRAFRVCPTIILLAAPPIVLTYHFALGGTYSINGAAQVSLTWMPLLVTCWLTAYLVAAYQTSTWSIWDTVLCATSATVFAGLISQGFQGSTHSIWPLMIINFALVIVKLTTSRRSPNPGIITGAILLSWIVFAFISVDVISLTRYAWIARADSASSAPAQFEWVRTPGSFLADASSAARLYGEYSRIGPTALFPGEEPVAFLTGQVPHSDVSASDSTTNPSYGNLAGWLDRNRVAFLILRRDSQIPDDNRLASVDDQLGAFVLVKKDGPFEVYKRLAY